MEKNKTTRKTVFLIFCYIILYISIKYNKTTMKNIGLSVSTILTPEKKIPISREAEEKADREAEFMIVKHQIIFHLKENRDCKIYAAEEWCENSNEEVVMVAPDIYFYHIRTNEKYKSPWACIAGIVGWDDELRGMWETLCMGIENLINLEKIIRTENAHGV